MNTRAMISRLNELDERVCIAFGISRSADATTLDEAIAMTAETLGRLEIHGPGLRPPNEHGLLADFLRAQVEARQLRVGDRDDVVRSLTAGIRRMKKAGSLQGLAAKPVPNFAKCSGSTARCCRSSKTMDSSSRNPIMAWAAPP